MFVDQVTIHVKGGKGGDGCGGFRREYKVPKGGPNGGDGGDGGDVVIVALHNVDSLAAIVGHKHWRGGNGSNGEGSLKKGREGEATIIEVPPGTLVKDADRGHVLKDMAAGERLVVARGGRGGFGNNHFKTSTNRAPREFEHGEHGEERVVLLELKLIADVGLIGKPNAGKSTLLSRLSRARPEIADYPFTTRHPNLGIVHAGYDREFVLADIPGLIEGAHAGVGLGHEFLRHVERTKVFVHLVEPLPADETIPLENYRTIRRELELYNPELVQRPELVVITKSELPEAAGVLAQFQAELDCPILAVSSVTGAGLPQLIAAIFQRLDEQRAALQSEPAFR